MLDKQSCLDPKVSFQNLDVFVDCFALWSDFADDPYVAISGRENNPFAQVITSCFAEYCLNPQEDLGGCGPHSFSANASMTAIVHPTKMFSALDCGTLNAEMNTDIAGPGVTASYIMQIGLLFYIWLMMRGLQFLPVIVGFFTNLRHGRGLSLMTKDPQSEKRQARLVQKFAEHLGVIRHALVEFQEAQCFFMIAVQAASLIALAGSNSFFDAAGLFQFSQNVAIIKNITTGAIVPITVGLLLLCSMGMNSWYILVWSFLTICLSTAVFGRSRDSYYGETPNEIAFPSQTTGLEKCGYKPPPLIWCSTIGSSQASPYLVSFNIVSLVLFGILLVLQLWPLVKYLIQHKLSLRQRLIDWSPPRWMRLIVTVLYVVTEVVMLGITVSFTYSLVFTLIIRPSKWNFGQLVSMFIWAPVISKYLSWAFFGTAVYSAIRFPAPFKLYNMNDDTASHRFTEGGSDPELGKGAHATTNSSVLASRSNVETNRTWRSETF